MLADRRHPFLRLWAAETVSQLGSQVSVLALPLVALGPLDAPPLHVGGVAAAGMAPFVLIGLPAGVWVDRLARKPILVAADIGRAAAVGSIALAHALGALTLAQLYCVSVLSGALTVFADVAGQSYLPELVERHRLPEANARLEVSRSGAQVAGPALAGLLVGLVGAPGAVSVDAASFLASAACIASIRRPATVPSAMGGSPRRRWRDEMVEGLRYLLCHPLLRPLAACSVISNLGSSMFAAMIVVHLSRTLELAPALVGAVFALGNVGFLAGALLARPLAARVGVGRAIVGSLAIGTPLSLLAPLAPAAAPLPFLVLAQLAAGVRAPIYNVNQISLRQAITPLRLLGRMTAAMRAAIWGVMPPGFLLGGIIGTALGTRGALVAGALVGSLAFLPLYFSPVLALRQVPDDTNGESDTAAMADTCQGLLVGARHA